MGGSQSRPAFAVAVIGVRLGERRTLAQLSAFDFMVAVAIRAIIGRGATAADTPSLPQRSRMSRSWSPTASLRSSAGTAGSSA